MRIIFDATALQLYGFAKGTFRGGTEQYLMKIIDGLSEKHEVHVVAPDLEFDERRGDQFWWPANQHPYRADVVVMVQDLRNVVGYIAEHFVLCTTTTDPWLGDDGSWGERLSVVPCMSQTHVDLLTSMRPSIAAEKCVITGLGVNVDELMQPGANNLFGDATPADRRNTVPGRMLYANDPTRGLWHTLQIFDKVRSQIPDATLHVAYDFDRQFEPHRWRQNDQAEAMWKCKDRIEQGNGVVNIGALTHDELIREQLECCVHVYPSDPTNTGSQTHGLTQMELAAAGVPLVLSDVESYPELFGECASILPLPGMLAARSADGDLQRVTYDDWAAEVVAIMQDTDRWEQMSRKSRETASHHTWPNVIDRWEAMLAELKVGVPA